MHAELLVDTLEAETEAVKTLVKDCMEQVITLRVPLVAEVRSGRTWYEAK